MLALPFRLGQIFVRCFAWLVVIYLALPLIVIIGASFSETAYLKFPPSGFTVKWYETFLRDPTYLSSIWLSAWLAFLATILAVIFSVPAALVLMRKLFIGRGFLNGLFLSPLILPLIVIGAALLQFASYIGLMRTFTVLLLGHTVIVLPYIIRTTLAALANMDHQLEEASLDLGANNTGTFFRITLPIIKPGIVAGAVFAFVISWINVELSMFHTTPELMPIPVKLFNYVQYSVDPTIAAVSAGTIYLAIVLAVLLDITVGIDRYSGGR